MRLFNIKIRRNQCLILIAMTCIATKAVLYTEIQAIKNKEKQNKEEIKEKSMERKQMEVQANLVSDLVQKYFHTLQNPKNCSEVKTLICQLGGGNQGFGNTLHRLIYCFNVGFWLNRTIVIGGERWKFALDWEDILEPLSSNCTSVYGPTVHWPGNVNSKNILAPLNNTIRPFVNAPPFDIPESLHDVVAQFHKAPEVWWVGQIAKYIMKPVASLQELIKEYYDDVVKNQPIIGLHVRKSDKTTFRNYDLKAYMNHVNEFYLLLEKTAPVAKKLVYLATDDPETWEELRRRFPEYTYIGCETQVVLTEKIFRSTTESMRWLLVDMLALMKTDLVVCSMASNICLLTYEMRQSYKPDYHDMVRSIDIPYHYYKMPNMPYKKYLHSINGNISAALPYINYRRTFTNYTV